MYEERRKYPRLSINIRVDWDKGNSSALSQRQGSDITKDISEGGICLIGYDKLEVGHRVGLKIELPTKKTIRSIGRVVWIKEFDVVGKPNEMRYDMGIEFLEIDPKDREEMRNFVTALLNNNNNHNK